MRRVFVTGTPPEDWLREARAATEGLAAAEDDEARQKFIEQHERLWRDTRIRDWLLSQFHNKCWYTEAYDTVSAIHVDHYRPKGTVKGDEAGQERQGYWWLAFEWTNYRICGQLINVKKNSYFPILEGFPASFDVPQSLALESPVLVDPISEDARLVSYEMDEGGCRAAAAEGVPDDDRMRVDRTISILGLNRLARLNEKRADKWQECRLIIMDYKAADGPMVLKRVVRAAAVRRLREMVRYSAEFSSVSEACIRKTAPYSLVSSVFDSGPEVRSKAIA